MGNRPGRGRKHNLPPFTRTVFPDPPVLKPWHKFERSMSAEGLTCQEVANRTGCNHQVVRNLASGHTAPWLVRVGTAQVICSLFDKRTLRVEDFFNPS